MTITFPEPQQQGGGGMRFGARMATYGLAREWNKRAHARQDATSGSITPTDLTADPQYPATWEEYIGQRDAKATLQDAIARAKARNEPLRHVLIANGEPGIGKTALAVLVARYTGARCFTVSGTPTKTELAALLSSLHDNDILFIDEIHRLVAGGKAKAEWLLHLLQDGAVMGPTGITRRLRVTVIGATTDVAKLPDTVVDRFGIQPVLERLSPDEALYVAQLTAERLFPPLPVPHYTDLALFARAADGNPRRIQRLLELAVDWHYGQGYEGLPTAEKVLHRARMTWDGLDWTAQRYLVLLRQALGAIGEAQIRNLLQEAELTSVERRLADRGLISFTTSGRVLTDEGASRAAELIAEGVYV